MRKTDRTPSQYIVTVHFNSPERPGQWIAKLFNKDKPTGMVWRSDCYESLIELLPSNLTRYAAISDSDTSLVEYWV